MERGGRFLVSSAFEQDGTGSTDPDGSIERWQWIQTEGPTVALSNTDTATPQFEAPQVDDGSEIILTLRLTATDNDGLTAVDNWSGNGQR